MARKFTPIYLFFGLTLLWVATTSNSSNPPNGRTGAPGDGLCSNCHFGGGSFDGGVSITGLPAVADPNTTYPITVTVSNPNGAAQRAGFQWVALNSANQNTGSISVAGPSSTITPSGGRVYHEHNPAQFFGAGTTVSWTANWTSPAAPAADDVLTFYSAAVIANGSGTSGDLVVTDQVTVQILGGGVPLSGTIINPIDVSCNGGSDGQATAVGNGGNPPYTYNWSSGSTNETATNLTAGTNTVTITDSDFNSVVADVTLGEPSAIVVNTNLIEGIDCINQFGSASASASGGTGNLQYQWSNGETGQIANMLPAGMAMVSVTDENQCVETSNILIPENTTPPSVSLNSDGILTCDNLDVIVNSSSTCSNCNYNWSTQDGNITAGATTSSITVDAPGTYILEIIDPSNGCSTTEDIAVTEDILPPTVDAGDNAAIDCNTPSTTLNATVSACNNCEFSWTTNDGNIIQGANTLNAEVDAGGTYTFTATNLDNGCFSTDQVVVTADFDTPSATITGETVVNCTTSSISLTATVTNCSNCEFLWSTADGNIVQGANTTTILLDAAGTYTFTVTNLDNGCEFSVDQAVSEDFVAPDLVINGPSVINCTTPSITLSSTAANCTNCSFSWTTMDGNIIQGANTNVIELDAAGTYIVTATNPDNGCTSVEQTMVSADFTAPSVSINDVDTLDCNTLSVSISTTVSDCSNCEFEWSTTDGNILGANDMSVIDVDAPGTYTVIATNADNGCEASAQVTVVEDITVPGVAITGPMILTCVQTSIVLTSNIMDCTNCSLSWSTDVGNFVLLGNGDSIEVDAVGSYELMATNLDNGCSSSTSITISQDVLAPVANAGDGGVLNCNVSQISLQGSATDCPSCEYSWSTNDGQIIGATNNASAVAGAAGTYTLTTTNPNNGCTDSDDVVVSSTPEPTLAITTNTPVSCNGGSDGSASVQASGGTAPYTYEWSSGATEETETDLEAGTYFVTATDADGCTATTTVVITEPDVLLLNATSTPETSAGANDGSASVQPDGGTPPYTYLWNTGATEATITDLTPDFYEVTVTDANGCTSNTSVAVSSFNCNLIIQASSTDASCNGFSDGTASLNLENASMPITVAWSNGAAGLSIDDLSAGQYTATVTDANNCSSTATVVISEPELLQAQATTTDVDCFGEANGSINVDITGGTPPYTVSYSDDGDGTNLPAGNYDITVTDANNCSTVLSVTISQPTQLTAQAQVQNVSCFGANDGAVSFDISGGTPPYVPSLPNGQSLSNLAPGAYTATIVDANLCEITVDFDVTEPPILGVDLVIIDATCSDAADGSIVAVATGGTPPYVINYPNGGDGTGLPVGTYSIEVVDGNGCTTTVNASVNSPGNILISATVQHVSCFGANDGVVFFDIAGGTPPYSIGISNGEDPNQLPPGVYTATVVDVNGCVASIDFEILEPGILEIELIDQSDITCADPDGSLTVAASGGTPGYTYLWSNGVMGPVNESAATGSTVTVTDANGCQLSMTYTLTEDITPPSIIIEIDGPVVIDCNTPEIVLTAQITDCDNCEVAWTTVDGNIVIQNSPTSITIDAGGTYTITATNLDNGCSASESIQIEVPVEIDVAVAVFDVLCAGEMTGSAEIIVIGGTPPYNFTLIPAGDLGALGAGSYTLVAEDVGGCVDSVQFEVDEPLPIVIDAEVTQPENGNDNGAISLDVSGGVGGYTFNWLFNGEPFSNEEDLTDLAPGEYTVIIFDENNCEIQETFILDNVNAVASIEQSYEVEVFPNPVSDWLTIEMTGNSAMEMNIGLYSFTGQLVYNQGYPKATQRQERVDISVYPSGVYWLRVQLDGEIEVYKVVVE